MARSITSSARSIAPRLYALGALLLVLALLIPLHRRGIHPRL